MLRLLLLLLFGTCVVAHTAHEKEHAAPRRVVLAKVHAARETARLASGSFFWAVWRFSWKNPISAEGGWTCKYDENIRHHTITLSTSKVVVLLYGIYLCVHVSISGRAARCAGQSARCARDGASAFRQFFLFAFVVD